MLNNAYQNLSLENIDISLGGTGAKIKDSLSQILANKLVILCGLVLNGKKMLPVVVQCDATITQSEEPDDWDEEEDGEFVPEDIYSVTFKNVYGYDIAITDNVISTAKTQNSVDANIASIIESGLIDNAKPIYYHPIYVSNDRGFRFQMSILDQNPEKYTSETWAPKVKELMDDGAFININGAISHIAAGSSVDTGYLMFKSGDTYQIRAFSSTNNNIIYDLDSLLAERAYGVTDSVHKIN